jgi:hypothetical protein
MDTITSFAAKLSGLGRGLERKFGFKPFDYSYRDFARKYSRNPDWLVRQDQLYALPNEVGQKRILKELEGKVEPGVLGVSTGLSGLFLARAIPECSGILVGDVNKAVIHLILPALVQAAKDVPVGDRGAFLDKFFLRNGKKLSSEKKEDINGIFINDVKAGRVWSGYWQPYLQKYLDSLNKEELKQINRTLRDPDDEDPKSILYSLFNNFCHDFTTPLVEGDSLSIFLNDESFAAFQALAVKKKVKGMVLDFMDPSSQIVLDQILEDQGADMSVLHVSNIAGWQEYQTTDTIFEGSYNYDHFFVKKEPLPSGNKLYTDIGPEKREKKVAGILLPNDAYINIQDKRKVFFDGIRSHKRLAKTKIVHTELDYSLKIDSI